jgi:hypothetical protein
MLSVTLKGGLGNQLFQLAFLDYVSKITGRKIFLQSINSPSTVHSQEDYFQSIFKNWKVLLSLRRFILARESPLQPFQDWKGIIETTNSNVMFDGYFQRFEYMDPIRDSFISKLSFDESILQKHNVTNKIGIHIRGGDYKNNSYHELPLKNYYEKCMSLFPNSEFVVFTNDIPYAKNILDCEIIQESEIDTLFLMSKCRGLICANSSFSWWGAYLNPERPICMPSKWYTGHPQGNYYFKGVIVVDINV